MKNPVPLYYVQFPRKNPTDKFNELAGAFIFEGGAFRYLPESALLAVPGTQSSLPQRIRVGGNVQQVALLRQVQPTYPPDAKRNHIQGTVLLHAIVAKDGTMKELLVISGPPELYPSALDAVRQWVYKPTLLQGQPVEVDTSISVVYQLGRH
jgi:TonB family protein